MMSSDVVRFDAFGRARPRHQIAICMFGVAHADMAEGIHHAFMSEDAVGGDKFIDQEIGGKHDAEFRRVR
jgi:hypothetical protein